MRFAVCDNTEKYRERLILNLNEYCGDTKVDEFTGAQNLLASFAPQKYNAVFINAEQGGLQIASDIRKSDAETEIVLCTSMDTLSTIGYEIGTCDIFRINSSQKYRKQKLSEIYQKCYISNHTFEYQQEKINARHILYFHQKPLHLIMKTDTEIVPIKGKLNNIRIFGFIRISADYYVNPMHILFYGNDFLLLDSMERIPYKNSAKNTKSPSE